MSASFHIDESLAERLQRNSFLVVGRAGMDFYPDPPGTATENANRFVSHLGGSSANICVALTKHAGQASLLTCVSDDSVGRFCIKQLQHYGVDASYVRSVGGEFRNSLAVSESRVEDHQTVIYRNGAADFQMNKLDVERVDYKQYGALITTGTVLIIGNDVEFGFMAGGYEKGLNKARELAQSSASIVIYKMGEKGSITLCEQGEFQTGIFLVDALKPTGAGDSFMGGFIASLAAGYGLQESVLRGSACASIVVSKVGCAPAMPNKEELARFLEDHPGPSSHS